MTIMPVTAAMLDALAPLAADFRVTLRSYKGLASRPDVSAGREEIAEYLAAGWPVFAAMDGDICAGYAVCKVVEPCVWLESLYVAPEHRYQGIATALLREAETLGRTYGEETVFHNVHPNNHGMIAFLRRHGYTVLNLIEIRKPWLGETLTQTIRVGDHEFDY